METGGEDQECPLSRATALPGHQIALHRRCVVYYAHVPVYPLGVLYKESFVSLFFGLFSKVAAVTLAAVSLLDNDSREWDVVVDLIQEKELRLRTPLEELMI
jgi:hypothetical protein